MVVSKNLPRALLCGVVASLLALCVVDASTAGKEEIVEISDKAVTKTVLDNGLTILTKNSPPDGLVAVDVKILAGSALEGGYLGSGISHLLEHMVFKGTPTRGPGEIEREVKSYGGYINGSTSRDITEYHVIVPSHYLSQSLELIKDMLLNASFKEEELLKEKDVVLKEIRLNADEPQSRLIKRLYETSYLRHPYKYPPIGYENQFKTLTRNDLLDYYAKMYTPSRIVLSIVGGIDEADAIAKAKTVFDLFRPSNYGVVDLVEQEPKQLSMRRLEDSSRANLAYLALGYHSTSYLDSDLFAMDVLAMIAGRGDNSRLNVALFKDQNLVYSISAWNHTPRYAGLFTITAILDKEKIDKAEESIIKQLDMLGTADVTDEELAGAKRMVLADYIESLQTVDAQASDAGLSQTITGSPDFSRRYVEGIQTVTKDDIRRVAAKYLRNSNLNVVRLLPEATRRSKAVIEKVDQPDTFVRRELPNGIRLLVRRDTRTPIISITAAMEAGIGAETAADNGISNLTAQMLLRGTRSRDDSRIQGFIEGWGGTISAFSGMNSFGIQIEVLKPDGPAAIDILADILSHSEFPDRELEREKTRVIAGISEEDDDIFASGINALRKELFTGSPYGLRYLGNKDNVNAISRDAIIAFYNRYCVSRNIVLSISGDIDPEAIMQLVEKKFSAMPAQDVHVPAPEIQRLSGDKIKRLRMDKEQSLLLLGFQTAPIQNPDRYALEVLGSVMSGYSGRLFDQLRAKRGLAYTLGCVQKNAQIKGYMLFYVATTIEHIGVSRDILLDEIKKIRSGDVTAEEIALAKRELRAARLMAQQSNMFYAFTAAADELYGLGYGNLYMYDSLIEKVSKEDVVRVARSYLDPASFAEITITPD